jgi:hypothetical protein
MFAWRNIGLAFALLLPVTSASARDAAADEHEIRRVETLLCDAFERGDADALRANLDKRFTLTSSRGEVTDFEQNLAEVARRDPFYDVFRNHDQKIRVYGNAAIVIGITTVKGHSGEQPFDGDFQFTDTWICEGGRRKLAASHASRLPK